MKFIGFCSGYFWIKVAPMTSCEVDKYTIIGCVDTGLTKMGGSTIIFLIREKVCSHCSFHLKASAFLNNFIIGFDLSARISINLAKVFNLSTNLYTSFKFFGLLIFKIASHLPELASMPLLISMNPKNFSKPQNTLFRIQSQIKLSNLLHKYFFKIFHVLIHYT